MTRMDKQENLMNLISFASARIPRVVRSTIAAETYQLQFTVESLDLVRAAIIDIKGKLNHRNWEMSAASQMQGLVYRLPIKLRSLDYAYLGQASRQETCL